MIFRFKKKPKRAYISFLNEADEEYIRAYSTKSTRRLKEYMTPDCLYKISNVIYGGSTRYFGVAKFRNTTWEIVSENETLIDFRKDVVYDKVKVSPSLKINIADNYRELWTLNIKDMKVVDVRTLA